MPANRHGLCCGREKLGRGLPSNTRCCGERNGKSAPKVIRRRFVPPLPRSLTGSPCKACLTRALRDEKINNFINLTLPLHARRGRRRGPLTYSLESTRIRFPGHFSDSACGESRGGRVYMLGGRKPESLRVTDSSLFRSRLVPGLNCAPWLRVVFPFASAHKSLCVAGPLAPDRRTSRPPEQTSPRLTTKRRARKATFRSDDHPSQDE